MVGAELIHLAQEFDAALEEPDVVGGFKINPWRSHPGCVHADIRVELLDFCPGRIIQGPAKPNWFVWSVLVFVFAFCEDGWDGFPGYQQTGYLMAARYGCTRESCTDKTTGSREEDFHAAGSVMEGDATGKPGDHKDSKDLRDLRDRGPLLLRRFFLQCSLPARDAEHLKSRRNA